MCIWLCLCVPQVFEEKGLSLAGAAAPEVTPEQVVAELVPAAAPPLKESGTEKNLSGDELNSCCSS